MGAGGKIELTFMVNSNWVQNLIGIAGSTTTSITGNPAQNFRVVALPATGVPPAATSNNTIYVAVTDFVLYMYKVPLQKEPRSVPGSIRMKKWVTNLYNLTSGSSINMTVSLQDMRHMTHIIIAFLQPTGITGKSSVTDFSCGFNNTIVNNMPGVVEFINTTVANNNISSFYITYDKQYPNPAYTFGNDPTNAMELSRAYYETLINTNALSDRSGSMFDFSTWLQNTIFVFKTSEDYSTIINQVNATINLKAANNNQTTTAVVMGLYDEEIKFEYDAEMKMSRADRKAV